MTISTILTPVAFVAALTLTGAPAYAGQHGGGGHGGGGHSGGGHSSGGSHGAAGSRGGPSRGGGATVSRSGAQPRSSSGARGGVTVRGGGGGPRGGGSIGPRSVIVGGRGFYRPYYTFRPRFNLGFGLYVGYPIAYPYFYDYPYYPYAVDPYAYGYAAPSYGYGYGYGSGYGSGYGYPAQPYSPNQSSAYPPSSYPSTTSPGDGSAYPTQPGASVGVQRGGQQSAPGGVSFEITPDSAAVFVDGTYVGTAGDFGPSLQPLGLIPGRHKIEIRASGYRTMTFDADVTPGQVIP